ncbi:MAG: hypothetical protein ACYTF7_10370 [Planctomycetota bacterium]
MRSLRSNSIRFWIVLAFVLSNATSVTHALWGHDEASHHALAHEAPVLVGVCSGPCEHPEHSGDDAHHDHDCVVCSVGHAQSIHPNTPTPFSGIQRLAGCLHNTTDCPLHTIAWPDAPPRAPPVSSR